MYYSKFESIYIRFGLAYFNKWNSFGELLHQLNKRE